MAFSTRAGLPTFTPPTGVSDLPDPARALRSAGDELLAFSQLAERFTKASWDVEFEDDDSLPFLVLTAPRRMDELDAFEQANELAGELADEFYGLDEF